MRIRRRSAIVLASAAALGVGLIAFPASSAAAPPVVPSCTFPNTSGSDSCASLQVNALDGSLGGALENASLGFRFRSQFNPQTSELTSVELRFDDNIQFNLSQLPSCPASELVNKNIAQAWEQCGPGADGNPPSEGNAYLSTGLPGDQVSGRASGLGFGGPIACVMIFKGADIDHLTIYMREPITPANGCDNPVDNTAGVGAPVFSIPISRQDSPQATRDWTITWSNVQTLDPPLDDFYATLWRAHRFQAKCPAGESPLDVLGVFDYTAAPDGDERDFDIGTDPCP